MRKYPVACTVIALVTLSACGGGGDPLESGGEDTESGGEAGELVIGSQDYYSNTVLAEIYAQVLEDQGYEVQREYEIGQREVYVPELESGAIDIFPEYTGNLLDFVDGDSEAPEADSVHAELNSALPSGLEVLDYAEATDQDSYVVTADFADEHDLSTVGDLADVEEDLRIASNAEFETRPYGIEGLAETYGVEMTLVPVEDSGGPLTLGALLDGEVQVANIYSADPAIEENDLVVLEDTETLVLPQNIVPVVSENVDDEARSALNEVQALLDQQTLLDINAHSQETQGSPADVAQWWLEDQDLSG